MPNEVENNGAPASEPQAVVVPVEPTTPAQELDYKALYFDSLSTNTKLTEERDNYKSGMLAAKGKGTPEVVPAISAKLEGEINFLKEQVQSLQNSKNANIGSGGSQPKAVETAKHGWGPDQVKDLKQRLGWTDSEIEKSWQVHQKNINKT